MRSIWGNWLKLVQFAAVGPIGNRLQDGILPYKSETRSFAETIELGGFAAGGLPLFGRLHDAALDDFAPEIALVERLAEDRLVDQLQFGERKPLRQEFEAGVGRISSGAE